MTDYPVWFDASNFDLLDRFKDKPDLRFLQIGVYTGDASKWLLDNILTHHSSLLIDVDTWQGSDEPAHHAMNFDDVYDYYMNRTADERKAGRVKEFRMTSNEFFIDQRVPSVFDFIYIDGDHHAEQTYIDGINAWRCLNNGGILAFDDYNWAIDDNPLNSPRQGIEKFLVNFAGQYKLLKFNDQVWMEKI